MARFAGNRTLVMIDEIDYRNLGFALDVWMTTNWRQWV